MMIQIMQHFKKIIYFIFLYYMNTIDITLIIICIFIVYLLINNYINLDDRVQHFKPKYIEKPKKSIKEMYKSNIATIEKINEYDYYPINLNLTNLTYVPDECLPLNFQYDKSVNTILLNGSSKIVSNDESLKSITSTSMINLNLILSKVGQADIYISISNIQFSVNQCTSNTNITISSIPNSPVTNLSSTFDSISGNLNIGLLTFPMNKIIFNVTPTLATLFAQNPKNNNSKFILQSVCSKSLCDTPSISPSIRFAPIISAPLNPIEKLIESKSMFALYAKITKKGMPSNMYTDPTVHKVYLSVILDTDGSSNKCGSTSGMLKFTNNLTQGSIFNANKEYKRFQKLNNPYKYLDFYNTITNTTTNTSVLESDFYNLTLVANKYSLTYCVSNCDQYNKHGFCAQEIRNNLSYDNKFDEYSIKNYMKFKFESDGSVTPYFINIFKDIEKIYFITNKYNSIDNDIAYKTVVQVPIYDNNGEYYEIPDVLVQNSINFPIVRKVPITGLNVTYTDEEISKIKQKNSIEASETKAFLNNAYTDYAISFFIEEIDPSVVDIKKLPLNE